MTNISTNFFIFLNSKVGLMVLGFILTTIVGTFLADRIERNAREHDVRFNKLHEDRALAIRDLHDRMVEIERDLLILNYMDRPHGPSPESVDEKVVLSSIREFQVRLKKARIYFRRELADRLSLQGRAFENAFRLFEQEIQKSSQENRNPQFDTVPILPLITEIESKRLEIEEELRTLIGVK